MATMKRWISNLHLNGERVDILLELYNRNLDHILQEILHHLDAMTLQNCRKVS